jgi:biopolymer transport protein ExbB
MRALRPSHREEREQFSQNLLEKRGYFAPFFGAILQKNYRTQEELVQEIRLLAHNTSVKMNRNLQMIGVLATTAPLLGLLGTVTGMVTTFEIITEYGNGNPVLLAGGISEALITTQSGLLIAFPILLLRNRLEDRNQWVLKRMEHAATRLIWRATQGGYYGSL